MKYARILATSICVAGLWTAAAAQGPTTPNPDFDLVASKLDEGGSFYLYVDVENVLTDLIDRLEPIFKGIDDPQAQAAPAIARSVVKSLGFDTLDDLGVSVTRLPDGMGRVKSYLHLTRRTEVFQFAGGNPRPLESLNFIPPDAVFAMAQNFDLQSLFPVIEEIIQEVGGAEALASFRDELAKAKKDEGIDPAALVQSLGNEACGYIRLDEANKVTIPLEKDLSLTFPGIHFACFLQVKNGDLFATLLEQNRKHQGSLKDVGGVEGFEVKAIDAPDNPFHLKPVVAQGKGWLVFASTVEELNAAIATAAVPTKNIRSSAEFQKLSRGLPSEINGVSFVSPRFFIALNDLLVQLAKIPGAAQMEQFGAIAQMLESASSGMGQLSVRVNESEGLYTIVQGDVSAGSAVRGTLIVPVAVLAAIAVPNFLEAQNRSRVARVRIEMRSLATGIESYYVDNCAYPAWTTDPAKSARPQLENGKTIPSFRLRTPGDTVASITTPIAYMTSLPVDPFAENEAAFGYYSVARPDGWVLFSPGPDGDFDLDWKVYDAGVAQPSPALLEKAYDPTNGTVSDGDLWRVKQ